MLKRLFPHTITLLLVFVTVMTSGCGKSDPRINPAQTLPTAYVDSSFVLPEQHDNWTNYHYGFWQYDPGFGWAWVPGYIWSPNQVVWYTGYELGMGSSAPRDIVLPFRGETNSANQGGHAHRTRKMQGGFDETNLQSILEKIQTCRVVATTRGILRADLALDFSLTMFGPQTIPPPGPPPVPHFIFVNP